MRLFRGRPLYIRIRRNHIHVRDVSNGKEVDLSASEPFSSERLIIANFSNAKHMLIQAAKETLHTLSSRLFHADAVIHQIDIFADGLSEVEKRLLQELGSSLGLARCLIYEGQELSDNEVKAYLDKAS